MPLEITPAKGGTTTLYLRIPKDVMKIHNITKDTRFTFELIEDKEGVSLIYRLQAAARKRRGGKAR